MQTIKVIQSIEWIDSLFSNKAKDILFSPKMRADPTSPNNLSIILDVTHELTRVSALISENKSAVEVLQAFQLTQLADITFATKFAEHVLIRNPETRDDAFVLYLKWRIMISSAKALKSLTIPSELLKTESNDNIISIELQFKETKPPLSTLSKAIDALEELYNSISKAYQIDSNENLKIVKADSGSNIKIDCKGAADIIKHLKDFFLEAWHKLRHKRADELIENNKATISSLAVIQQLDSLYASGSITHEEAERVKHNIIISTIKLFDSRALPSNIPDNENVNNIKMLDKFSPKLLNENNIANYEDNDLQDQSRSEVRPTKAVPPKRPSSRKPQKTTTRNKPSKPKPKKSQDEMNEDS